MSLRFTNITILILTILLTLTGVYGLIWTMNGWLFHVHRVAGWALIAIIPWKAAISWRSLKRGLKPNFDRGVVIIASLALALIVLGVMILALWWTWRLGPGELWLRQTAISWHWILALVLLIPFAFHTWQRWLRPKQADFVSRRAFVKLATLTAAGLTGWWLAEALARLRVMPDAPPRFTGSREQGSFSANQFPITQSAGEGLSPIDVTSWALTLHGAVELPQQWSYEQILSQAAAEITATVDCTLGWYSTQIWRGVRLADLLMASGARPQARAIRLKAATGYMQTFTPAEARGILLATHVGNERLEHWHGFPLRAVVPSRRGWFWVKWLAEIEVLT
jgi:hypothetical protein